MTPSPSAGTRAHKDFLSILDLGPDELQRCLNLAARVKAERALGREAPTANVLAGRHVVMLFEKSSLRTRSTFEVAIRELGGNVFSLEPSVVGAREPVADVARNLERWVDVVIIRTFSQQMIRDFASAAPRLHVVNALTDEEHPCQALADLLTLQEHLGSLKGKTLAYVGDSNNVALSLVQGAAMVGMHAHVASPDGYQLSAAAVQEVAAQAARHGARLRLFTSAATAVDGVDAVYTDTWTSMGREAEAPARRKAFEGYQVNGMLMGAAKTGALFMHCLPAHRGEEVTADVIESPASVVFDQAENRLHVQKALLLRLLAPGAV